MQRFGNYKNVFSIKAPSDKRIWIHAVSVGEINAAFKIIEALFLITPNIDIVISSATTHGLNQAKRKISEDNRFKRKITPVYAPIDMPFAVTKAINYIKPDILAILETEIWPNLFIKAKKAGIKTVILNGRISAASFEKYLKIKSLIKYILSTTSVFSMAGKKDAERIKALGADKNRIIISGNAKFDFLNLTHSSLVKKEIMKLFDLSEKLPVFIAGSIRGKEADIILDIYKKIVKEIPETILIIAPRHINRVEKIYNAAKKKDIKCQIRSDINGTTVKRKEKAVIIDSIGELNKIYGVATVVFCGGSLIPLGGHNILEAAAWGKPICYGPFMDDFAEAKRLIEDAGGGIQVENKKELAEKVIFFLKNRKEAENIGKKAQRALTKNTGAAEKHAKVIYEFLA
ncbi:MAG: hypothetical protein JRJ49_08710 [Deltaproteobacteria bacterium]|nr:hypothetical protein [Deltaproteobacteria bacterium]